MIFTKGLKQQYAKDVQEVLRRLKTVGFKTVPYKCEFFKKEVKFLGFIISIQGIAIDPEKTKSIKE